MRNRKSVACPVCGKQYNLALYIHGEYVARLPIENGELNPTLELMLNPPGASYKFEEQLVGDQIEFPFADDGLERGELIPNPGTFLRFSGSDSETTITLYKDEARGRIFCQSCNQVFTLDLDKVPDYLGDGF